MLVDERVEVERAIRVHELTEARGVESEALRQLNVSEQLSDGPAVVDAHAADQAVAGFVVIEQNDAAIGELERRVSAAAPEVQAARAREAELSSAAYTVGQFGAIDRSRESDIRDALSQLRRLAAEPEPAIPGVPAPDPGLVRYRQVRTELLSLASATTVRWDGARLLMAAVVAVASIVLAAACRSSRWVPGSMTR